MKLSLCDLTDYETLAQFISDVEDEYDMKGEEVVGMSFHRFMASKICDRMTQQAQPVCGCGDVIVGEGSATAGPWCVNCVHSDQQAQPEMPTLEQVAALRRGLPPTQDVASIQYLTAWNAALDAVLALFRAEAKPNPRHCCNTPIVEGPHEPTCWARLHGFADRDTKSP